ncbi:MAG TPA: DUF1579 family protein [Longimicrobiales bacterium]
MSLDAFLAAAGRWRGVSRLTDPQNGLDDTCPSTATAGPALQEKFVRITYAWEHRGKSEEGLIMIAHDPADSACQLYWGDTFHMGRAIMSLHGHVDGSCLSARGTYPVPGHPDWGWRIDVACEPASLCITMYNITPEGTEEIAVRGEYTRG